MKPSFYLLLTRAYRAQKNTLRPGMPALGLSPGQPKILNRLLERDGCMQKELAALCDIQPATVSKMLDTMEQNGLIRRGGEGERRRAASVSITEKGREAYAGWQELCSAVEAKGLQDFSQEEKERFEGYLRRLYFNLTGRDIDGTNA